MKNLKQKYIKAIDLIYSNENNKAKAIIESINTEYPNYGDVQILLKELNLLERTKEMQANLTPYLFALQELGINNFLELIEEGIPQIIKEYSESK